MVYNMIRKAVITAAGRGTRHYPATNSMQKELIPLVDRDGISKPTIQIIIEEAFTAGIEQICLVVQPGQESRFQEHFHGLSADEQVRFLDKKMALKQAELLERMQQCISYAFQTTQEGYGHAVFCARDWVGNQPFLLLLGVHVYLSAAKESCAEQIIQAFNRYQNTIYAVQRTPAELLFLFGTVAGKQVLEDKRAYQLQRIIEKPDVAYARRYLQLAGLPENTFLTFFGMHAFIPEIFEVLQEHINKNLRENEEIQLTSAQSALMLRKGAIGYEIHGQRLDMGTPLGYLETQLSLALSGPFKHDVMQLFQKIIQKEP
jgi:UTP--glucose-1-phosphate uridylyltransferase